MPTELAVDPGGTLVHPQRDVTSASWSAVIGRLPSVDADSGPLVSLGTVLGRGGMGVVHVGRQRDLDRDVAVKLSSGGEAATEALLREAWITGQLEHPNVIPVHALYRADHAPLLVMKRVEGQPWSNHLREEKLLAAHLRILTQVCHAVHFAHTRGFVHLDLKPDNVMIGEFGEIYLLDWGIAACTSDDAPDFIPRARGLHGVLGTPSYMAPELAAAGGEIDERTDVYLLAAVLHEVLTGRPPHAGETLVQTVMAAYVSEPPTWPESVPPELAAIAERGLARERDARFATAAELREAIEGYLVHADSLQLAAAARERIAQIALAIERERDGDLDSEVDRLAGEAEFGLRQALHVWEDNAAARADLQALLEMLIERDLTEKRWPMAARRIAELPEARPDLTARVEALEAESSSLGDELRRHREAVDLGQAARQRGALAYLLALGWGGGLISLGLADHLGLLSVGVVEMLLVTAAGALPFAIVVLSLRRVLLANAINRSAIAVLATGWLLGVHYWLGQWIAEDWMGASRFDLAVVGIGPLTAYVIGAGTAGVDHRLIPHAVVAVAGSLLSAFAPQWALEILGATGALVLVMLGRTWKGDAVAGGDRAEKR